MTEQRTPEWHAARRGLITASAVGAILGNSPYATRDDAMRAHVRSTLGEPSEFTGNVATEWGAAMEDTARSFYEMETGNPVQAVGFIIREDWAGCSPDGLIGNDGGVEFKCPYGIRNDAEPVFKTLEEQPHYNDQVQFSLWVTGREWWDFYQWTPHGEWGPLRVVSDEAWRSDALPRLRQFHAEALAAAQNDADTYRAPRRIAIDTPAAAKAMREWDEINETLERVEARKKDLLAEIVALAGDRDADVAGRKVTRVEKAGAVSYAKAIKALAPDADLEPWRGKPTSYWKVT